MPEMPIARIVTPTTVPQTLTRPGLIVVEPRKAPTSAGSRYSRPTLAWPMRSLRGEQDAGESGQKARGDEGEDRVAADRNAVELGGLRIGADGVEVAADRQIFEHEPERDRQREHVVAGDRQAEQVGAVQRIEGVRSDADDLATFAVPHRDRIKDRAGAERRDEGVDLGDLDQKSVDETDAGAEREHDRAPRAARERRTGSAG